MAAVPLDLVDLSKSYGLVHALKPLSLCIREGELLALLGPSGCGKTTTLRLIAGFEVPDTGSVVIDGRDVTDLPPNKRALGMVFQNYSLFPHMTVGENIAFGLRVRGVNAAERGKRVREMLAIVRLQHVEDRHVHQLSGGQQQRVALARALATAPAILLLDEPLGALDKNLRESMQFELRELQRRFAITSILVTHDQEEALTMSDRVAVMYDGTVVQVGAPGEVYNRPRSRFVSEFLGTSNILAGTLTGQVGTGQAGAGQWRVTLDIQPGAHCQVAVPDGTVPVAPGGRVLVAVRPERLRLAAPGPGMIRAVVRDAVFRGAYLAYELAIEGQDGLMFAYSHAAFDVPADGVVGIGWPDEGAVLLEDAP
jgi:putative spermidine/putrescine transport system ATP-binding protein